MNTLVAVKGRSIGIELKPHAIKIYNDDALSSLLSNNADAATEELIACIKKEYFKLFNIDFNVSDASIAIEIWAHVYAEKFAESVKNFSSVNLVDKLAEKIMHHAEIIDIGEKGHDENRFVWDGLAGFKPVIAGLLFSN